MMKYVLTYIFLLVYAYGSSQAADRQETYARSITAEKLRKHLYSLADSIMEGRETATEGQRKAANYIEQQFRDLGLSSGWNTNYQQHFPVYQDSLVKASLTVEGKLLRQDTDFVVSSNSAFNVSFMASEVLFAGYGLSDSTRDDYKDVNARGKIVMVIPGAGFTLVKNKKIAGRVPNIYTLQDAAQRNGAIALLIIDKNFPRSHLPDKGSMYVNDYRKEGVPNTFFISDSVARTIMGTDYYVARALMKRGPPPPKSCYISVLLELDKSTERLESTNVMAILEGTDKKDEAVVISAHYDHLGKKDSLLYYGADDDGSGSSAVLGLAEAFAKAAKEGFRPKRSIIFMTVSGEENGLWGSSYYTENPLFPLEKTSVDLNIDMIGRIEKGRVDDSLNYVYVVGDHRISSESRSISEEVNNKYTRLALDYKFNDPNDPMKIFYRSDHYNFAKNGVPVIFYFNGLHEDYHRPTDTPDKINYELLAKRTQLIFYTAWEIANKEEMLKRDIE